MFHPALLLVQFNGAPETRKMVLELADGLLAHRRQDRNGKYSIHATINFQTDEDRERGRGREEEGMGRSWPVLWSAWRWSNDPKYLQPFLDQGPSSLRLLTVDGLDMLQKRDTWGVRLVIRSNWARNDGGDRP